MSRDTFKGQEYFDRRARFDEEALEDYRRTIAAPGTDPEHRHMLRYAVYRQEVEHLITRYSRGDSVADLRASYPRVLDALEQYSLDPEAPGRRFEYFDGYVFTLWIASLGILLEVDDAVLRRAVTDLDHGGEDALFDRLVAPYAAPRAPASTLLYARPYAPLLAALDAQGDERTRLIEEFLDGYYDGMGSTHWHDSHTGDDAGFFGYWCFELAAFVKQLGIDDAAFAGNVYYPRDLVHAPAQATHP